MRADVNAGPKELNEDFIRSLPDNGPVVMVNLLRFKGEDDGALRGLRGANAPRRQIL